MKAALGSRLKIRAMVHVAGEAIPYFWPMRTFIHHNPLYGLEHLSFHEAVLEGSRLFHGRGYLPRVIYQRYLAEGKIDPARFSAQIGEFLDGQPEIPGLDRHRLLLTLAKRISEPVARHGFPGGGGDIHAVLKDEPLPRADVDAGSVKAGL
ncbi:MAG: putative inorganic carbon transporter subunit DabA, partial [Burkholderiales bacterium]